MSVRLLATECCVTVLDGLLVDFIEYYLRTDFIGYFFVGTDFLVRYLIWKCGEASHRGFTYRDCCNMFRVQQLTST
jgi:hypothetical protein